MRYSSINCDAEISFSDKRFIRTPRRPVESDPARGRSALSYPQEIGPDRRATTRDGASIDITSLPFADRHEDHIVLAESSQSELGWLALRQRDSDWMFLSLKNAHQHPFTNLWFSNGGRDYAPWSGRHVGVIGIEEGRTYAGYGHAAKDVDRFPARSVISMEGHLPADDNSVGTQKRLPKVDMRLSAGVCSAPSPRRRFLLCFPDVSQVRSPSF